MISKDYVVGKLLVRKFRAYLTGLKYMGYELDWLEQKDWFENHFFVKGNMESIMRIESAIERAATEHQFS